MNPSDAAIVYGVSVEGAWAYPRFGIGLAQYNVSAKSIAGNCFLFNRTEFSVVATQRVVQYAVYSVPAGYYIYSPFNTAHLASSTEAFEAPAGAVVYAGDFVLTAHGNVAIRRNLASAKQAIQTRYPSLAARLSQAATVPAEAPRPFLCAP
ncbi:MAG TPA: hypothetical protein VGQ93_05975 [Lysobacter sp.]|nr:hypothetical protein [Lysobacter sp.]